MEKKKIGLALGGGSARGFAHIGVIKALEENKIPVHMIAGCSMGSLVGGIYCAEKNLETLEQLALVFRQKKYYDLTINKKGYMKGDKVEDLIKVMTKNYSFHQAKLPFSCIATCIEECELVQFTEGPIHEAVRASISLPGVFLPVIKDGKTYVDGGVMDRTAISAAKNMGADVVIAVDVSYRGEPLETPKGLPKLMLTSYTICSWQLAQRQLKDADMVIVPDVYNFSADDYQNVGGIIDSGYQAAIAAMPQIKELIEK